MKLVVALLRLLRNLLVKSGGIPVTVLVRPDALLRNLIASFGSAALVDTVDVLATDAPNSLAVPMLLLKFTHVLPVVVCVSLAGKSDEAVNVSATILAV